MTLAEAQAARAGGASVRLRLSELLFVEVIRRHLETQPANGEGWLSGLADPVVGRALTLLHRRPARPPSRWRQASGRGGCGARKNP